MKRNIAGWLAAAFAALALAGCSGPAEEPGPPSSVGPADLAASPIARLAKAIEDGDAATVAAAVSYPLRREPPLPDIRDESGFIERFPVIFDETFRNRMRSGRFSEDWEEVGWRGTMYDNGKLWVAGTLADGGKIYWINYQSAEEGRLREALLEKERATLHPSLAGTCDLVLCFATDDGIVCGRVDREGDDEFRVLLYNGPARTGGRRIPRGTGTPRDVFRATAEYHGSGGDHVYLDRSGRFALDVNVITSDESPDLVLHDRLERDDDFEAGHRAHYVAWNDLVEPPTAPAPR